MRNLKYMNLTLISDSLLEALILLNLKHFYKK